MSTLANVGRGRTRCPRCDVPLGAVKAEGISLAGCGKCRGVWVDRKSFDRISNREARPRRFGLARDVRSRRLTAMQRIKCPVCYYWMDTRNFEHCPELVVDVCRRHGAWLDTKELQAIFEFVKRRQNPAPATLIAPVAAVGVPTVAAAVVANVALASAAAAPVESNKDRSILEGVDVALDLLDFVDIGDLSDLGELVMGVAEIGLSVFEGL